MAGIPKDYYRNIYKQIGVEKNEAGVEANINYERLGALLDLATDALDAQILTDMLNYVPLDSGNLRQSINRINMAGGHRSEVYTYDQTSDYGHYQYEGVLYVDPEYGIGAFYDPMYGFWSRPGVEKVKSDKYLQYTQPMASRHWDEAAYNNHINAWVDVVRKYTNRL